MNRIHLLALLCLGSLVACTPTEPDVTEEEPQLSRTRQPLVTDIGPIRLKWDASYSCPFCGVTFACAGTPQWGSGTNAGVKTFTDPVPAGGQVLRVSVRLFSAINGFYASSARLWLNGTQLGAYPVGPGGICLCSSAVSEIVYDQASGVPGYVYGGANSIRVDSSDPNICASWAEVYLRVGYPKIASAVSALDFGDQRLTTSSTLQVKIVNTGDGALKIKSINAGPSAFSTSSDKCSGTTVSPRASCTVDVTFAPTVPGRVTGSLLIASNDPVTPSLVVSLAGYGVQSTAIVSPTSIVFPTQRVGAAVSTVSTVQVTNTGSASLEVSGIGINTDTPTGADVFAVDSTTGFTLGAGESHTFRVTFAPTAVTSYTGKLFFTTNDPQRPNPTVLLFGNGDQPEIKMSPSTLDFGILPVGTSPMSKSLTLENTGGFPVTVDALNLVATSDGGMPFSATLPTDPLTLEPGDKQPITVTFAPGLIGTFTGTLTPQSDALLTTPASVSLLGQASLPSVVTDQSLLDFGNKSLNTHTSLTLTVENKGTGSFAINGVSTNAPFTVNGMSTPFPLKAGDKQTLTVTFTPTEIGPVPDGALVLATSDPVVPKISVTLKGSGAQPVMLLDHKQPSSLSSIDFGVVRVGLAGSVDILFQNGGTASLSVAGLSLSGDDTSSFSVSPSSFSLAPGFGQIVSVRFKPTAERLFSATLVVTSDDPANLNLLIPVKGEGSISALDVTPRPLLDFGKMLTGRPSEPRPITVVNTGDQPITLSQLVRSGPGASQFFLMSPPPLPYTLQPVAAGGTPLMLNVVFAPSATGEVLGQLQLVTDEPGAPKVVEELRGEGIASVLKVSPTALDFGTLDAPDEAYGQLVLTNESSETITLAEPKLSSDQVDQFDFLPLAMDVLEPGASVPVEVHYIVTGPANSVATLTFGTLSPVMTRAATATLTGKAVSSLLDVDPLELDFGRVGVGASSEAREIRITNSYNTARKVSVVDTPDPAFVVDSSALKDPIAPGATAILKVTFSPKTSGDIEGELVVSPGGDIGSTEVISLMGNGRAVGIQGGASCASGGGDVAALGLLGLLGLGLVRRRSRG